MMLGPVSEFVAIDNDKLQATLIDAHIGSERRILLLSLQDDGRPLLEDLSGEIALAAGRGPMSGTNGIDLDLERFGSTGQIGVHGGPEDNGSGKSDSIDIGQQIAFEQSRQGVAAQH
jgi:hypothetical protein